MRTEAENLAAEQARLEQAVADAQTLADVGVDRERDMSAERDRVAAIARRLPEIEDEQHKVQVALADYQRHAAALQAREADLRREAEEVPRTALLQEKARQVRRIRQAHVCCVAALRDASAFNAAWNLPRPDKYDFKQAGQVLAIDRAADDLEPGGLQKDLLLHRQHRGFASDTAWVEQLLRSVHGDDAHTDAHGGEV